LFCSDETIAAQPFKRKESTQSGISQAQQANKILPMRLTKRDAKVIRMNLVRAVRFESIQCRSLLVRRLFSGAAIR
jgi:hypothetical protein